jgi:pimeloyl-ACP methyl ester carboxylesterase
MTSPATAQTSAVFDEIYARVPAEQVGRIKEFRRTHPYKRLTFKDSQWEYIDCGRASEQTLLLLPGALSTGESTFPFIMAFENEYRIIAPSYALSLTMTGLCEGIAHILETEGIDKVHVIGGSYGGLVAQYFIRQYPDKALSLILSHTFVMNPTLKLPLKIMGKLFPLLPRSLFVPLVKMRLNKMLLSTLRRRKHPEYEFWRAFLNEAVASDRLKEVAVHQNKCLLELAREPQFTSDDLKQWQGKILIIDSDDDPAIPAKDRQLLRKTYPQAEVQTFRGGGHASSILKREETFSLIRNFLAGAVQKSKANETPPEKQASDQKMIPSFLQLRGVTRTDRQVMISRVRDAILNSGGYILDFHMFSNTAISINFEVSVGNIKKLSSSLAATNLNLYQESQDLLTDCCEQLEQLDERAKAVDIAGGLHITFVHDEPDLRIECPAIPG